MLETLPMLWTGRSPTAGEVLTGDICIGGSVRLSIAPLMLWMGGKASPDIERFSGRPRKLEVGKTGGR